MEYNRFQEILQEEAEKIPEKFSEGLNGGVIISEETKLSPYAQNNDLYIAGQYLHSYQMGKQIVIYYGSMMRFIGNLKSVQKNISIMKIFVTAYTEKGLILHNSPKN